MKTIRAFFDQHHLAFLFSLFGSIAMVALHIYLLILNPTLFYKISFLFYLTILFIKIGNGYLKKTNLADHQKATWMSFAMILALLPMPSVMVFAIHLKEDFQNLGGIHIYAYATYGFCKLISSLVDLFQKKKTASAYDLSCSFLKMECALFTLFMLSLALIQTFGKVDENMLLLYLLHAFIVLTSVFMIVFLFQKMKSKKGMI